MTYEPFPSVINYAYDCIVCMHTYIQQVLAQIIAFFWLLILQEESNEMYQILLDTNVLYIVYPAYRCDQNSVTHTCNDIVCI